MGEKEIHEAFLGMMQDMGVEKIEAIAEPAPVEAEVHKPKNFSEMADAKKASEAAEYRHKAAKALKGKAGMTDQEKLDALEKAAHCVAKAIAAQKWKMGLGG